MSAQAERVSIGVALRRLVVGYRLVSALWLTVLAVIAVATLQVSPAVAAVTVVLAAGWSALTAALRDRRHILRTWLWLAADVAVSALTILYPSLVGAEATGGFFGGYPFSTVLLAAWVRGFGGALLSAGILASVTVTRLRLSGAAGSDLLDPFIFYLVGAGILAWGITVLYRFDAQRRAAETALASERAERALAEERAETAAHLHDSVLQTLALIQRRSADPAEVRGLARRQEAELRDWLSPSRGRGAEPSSLVVSIKQAAAEIEATHRLAVDVVTVGDVPVHARRRAQCPGPQARSRGQCPGPQARSRGQCPGPQAGVEAIVAATREALVNAAKHAAVAQVSVYAEVGADGLSVFVRDRGRGFDPSAVPDDRRGISASIVGRLARHGGRATVRSAPGEGTEVAMTLPRAMIEP